MYVDEKGIGWKFNFRIYVDGRRIISSELRKVNNDEGYNLALDWKDEKEMNRELSKLCSELGYTTINEHKDTGSLYDDGRIIRQQNNNGADLTLMVGNKMIIFELKNSGHPLKGAQGLGQLMHYMERDKDYMEWRKRMGMEYNDYSKLKHSELMGILVLADGRNIKYLMEMIRKIDYPIKLLIFNSIIIKSDIAKDNFIKSLKEAIE